ncbi:MAG: TrkA family potassium uptake protein [Lachnospiraceae bacterium]|nr:TrkA family potassium uptake protein [Lachnospiraceae bacterium]
MKNVLIIGVGRFGHHLCRKMAELGDDIMVVDQDESRIHDLLPLVTSARCGDCTDPEVLKSLGINGFDLCFVCIGTNFQSSLEITSQLKEMGAKYVISKATRDIQAKFLLRNGADEVVYPERDIAEKTAIKHSANNIFDYIELPGEFSIFEIQTPAHWVGKSIAELNIRVKYGVNVFGIRQGKIINFMPGSDYVFRAGEHLMVMGRDDDLHKLIRKK